MILFHSFIVCLSSSYLLSIVVCFRMIHVDLLQIILLLLAIIAVPWMLFPKPFILKKLHSEVLFVVEFFLGFYPFPEYNFRTYPHLVFMLVAVVFLVSSEPSVIALGHHL